MVRFKLTSRPSFFALTTVIASWCVLSSASLQSAVTVIPVAQAYSFGETTATTLVASSNQDSLVKVDPNNVATWLHGASSSPWQKTWQASGVSGNITNWGKAGWIIFDLGSMHGDLDKMYLWNVTENNATQTQRGINSFNIWYSTTPVVPGSAISNTNYSFDSAWTKLGATQTLASANNTADAAGYQYLYDGVFDLSSISGARYIAIEILTTHGSGMSGTDTANRVGLGEVVFTAVPEPSRALLILGGFALVLLRRRKQNPQTKFPSI